ncbi:response regulator transcription factor [Variovorax gossypii]|uniref:Response regulator transcription factor n=3 Tax=Variovorax TaxID=34072 RepID=A0A3S0IYQ8_9BURK|nr:response regulator transcription factor [Variovorax gossypii]
MPQSAETGEDRMRGTPKFSESGAAEQYQRIRAVHLLGPRARTLYGPQQPARARHEGRCRSERHRPATPHPGRRHKTPTTTMPLRSFSIAILGMDEESQAILQRHLGLLGHRSAAYAAAADLLAAMGTADSLDLLLLRPQDRETYQSLCAACNSLNTPALLVLHDGEWPHLLPETEDFIEVDAIEWNPTHSIEQELNWRMQQLWSRSRSPKPANKTRKERNSWGPYKFLLDSRTVLNRDHAIALSSFEFTLALELFRGLDHILTRDWLMHRLWADKPRMPDPRTLDVYATKVRRKLELTPENGFVLHGVYKQGYQLIALPQAPAGASETSA